MQLSTFKNSSFHLRGLQAAPKPWQFSKQTNLSCGSRTNGRLLQILKEIYLSLSPASSLTLCAIKRSTSTNLDTTSDSWRSEISESFPTPNEFAEVPMRNPIFSESHHRS